MAKALLNTEEARDALGDAEQSALAHPEKLFRASEVHLSNSNEPALFVMGSSPLSGADKTWFWLVIHPNTTPEIILFGGGNCIDILRSKTSGYRDVQTYWASASETLTTTFKFDGKKYNVANETRKPVDSE